MTLIDQIARLTSQIPNAAIQRNAGEMLVTLDIPGGRKQTVRVATISGRLGKAFIRMQSRARTVQNHKVVRSAMRYNCRSVLTSLALDASCDPPMLDVLLAMPAASLGSAGFINALLAVAHQADQIEHHAAQADLF